jgi:chorismate mutase/prephenate dehydratase
MFARYPVHICGEVLLPIHHCLLGRCSRDEVTEVHSKPQALSQCRTWLAQHLPDAQFVELPAPRRLRSLPLRNLVLLPSLTVKRACIMACMSLMPISKIANNVTRLCDFGRLTTEPTGKDKTSIMFQVPHKPGELADAMLVFRKSRFNLYVDRVVPDRRESG